MPKMASLSFLFILLLSLLHYLSGSKVQILSLHDSSPETLKTLSHAGANIAVYVSNTHLNSVSNTVLNAEKWVKTHLLTHYPSTKITTIVVGHNVLCNQTLSHVASSILPAMENLHYSLTRWGLNSKIEVSPVFSSNCFSLNNYYSQNIIKPMLHFLQNSNYSYSVSLSAAEEPLFSVSSHIEWVSKLGFSSLGKINLLKISAKEPKPINLRTLLSLGSDSFSPLSPNHSPISKLGFFNLGKIDILKIKGKDSRPINFRRLSSMGIDPFPPRPTPLSPAHSPVSVGPHVTLTPKPSVNHEYPHLPPCNPNHNPIFSPRPSFSPSFSPVTPSPGPMTWQTWCVAKPSVPAETLQEAMDYACGKGGADCDAIGPKGSCYYPDTVVAHASYAFNSYWQKSKGNGGTCAFGGTAMLINADPSYSHCRFVLS